MKRFKKIYVEIGNICNLDCDFCPETRRSKELMTIDDYIYILDQIKPYTDYIYFHVKGEPFVHPYIEEFLDISYRKGFRVNITTNGFLISEVKDKILNKPSLRQVNFSLHSFDGNYKGKNYIEEKQSYLNSIFDFIEEAIATSLIISLRLWNLGNDKENLKNLEILRSIEKEFDLDYRIIDKLQSDRGLKLRPRVYLNQDYEFTWPSLDAEQDEGRGFCYGLRDHVGILVDGTVVPCCLDGEGVIKLGNIKSTDFSKIINSRRAITIYDGFSQRIAVEELCKRCGFRRKFG